MRNISEKSGKWIADWLTSDGPSADSPLCDFSRLCYEICPGDVMLVEG